MSDAKGIHLVHVRDEEVRTLRTLLEERDALVSELRRDLGEQRRLVLGFMACTTGEQQRAAEGVAEAFAELASVHREPAA